MSCSRKALCCCCCCRLHACRWGLLLSVCMRLPACMHAGAADVLAWLDRQQEVCVGAAADLHATYLTQEIPRGGRSSIRLPFYERIFLIGLGASSDAEGTEEGLGGPTSRLLAAVTDVLLEKAVRQRAWDDVRERHGLRGAHLTLEDLPLEARQALKAERQARETELKKDVKVIVLDPRRPVHQALMQVGAAACGSSKGRLGCTDT